MPADLLLTPHTIETIWINRVIVVGALIHDLLLFIRVFIDQYKSKELGSDNKYQFHLYILTLVTTFSYVLYVSMGTLASFDIFYPYISCNTGLMIKSLAWCFGRYCLWLFSILRLRIVFHSSLTLQYKPITIKILLILFTIMYIILNFVPITACHSVQISLPAPNQNASYCELQCETWAAGPNLLGDQLASITCFVLFWKRFKLLMNTLNAEKDANMTYVLRKFTILIATNIFTTWMVVFAAILTPFGNAFGALDGVINMWTLVLFDKRYENIYQKMFKCVARTDLLTVNQLKQNVADSAEKRATSNTVTIVITTDHHDGDNGTNSKQTTSSQPDKTHKLDVVIE